ncbi:MAG: PTS sugar transporter subunit IIA [Chloroflexota bacterium]
MSILNLERIKLNAQATDKSDAIRQAGELLVQSGSVEDGYLAGMLEREASMSTYLGNGVAIPHGMHESAQFIKESAVSVLQLPQGVEWEDGEIVHLVIGIAATSDEHIGILSNLAEVVEEEESVMALAQTEDAEFILNQLNQQPQPE